MPSPHFAEPPVEIVFDVRGLHIKTHTDPLSPGRAEFRLKFVQRQFAAHQFILSGSPEQAKRALDDRFEDPITALDPGLDSQGRYRRDQIKFLAVMDTVSAAIKILFDYIFFLSGRIEFRRAIRALCFGA